MVLVLMVTYGFLFELQAETETDEVYAQITLQPEPDVSSFSLISHLFCTLYYRLHKCTINNGVNKKDLYSYI